MAQSRAVFYGEKCSTYSAYDVRHPPPHAIARIRVSHAAAPNPPQIALGSASHYEQDTRRETICESNVDRNLAYPAFYRTLSSLYRTCLHKPTCRNRLEAVSNQTIKLVVATRSKDKDKGRDNKPVRDSTLSNRIITEVSSMPSLACSTTEEGTAEVAAPVGQAPEVPRTMDTLRAETISCLIPILHHWSLLSPRTMLEVASSATVQ